jgi:hypothetical protein
LARAISLRYRTGFFSQQAGLNSGAKEPQMNLRSWEETVCQIAIEANQQPNEAGQFKVLAAWRAKLKAEPTSLRSFQIDEIVREVRRRFANG